jgi:hypothetical protein
MADRVSATTCIGGTLRRSMLDAVLDNIAPERLSTQWDGPVVRETDLPADAPLWLMAHEVAWGEFEALQQFCADQGLAYVQWSDGCGGQWGAQRMVFTGAGEPVTYCADSDDRLLIDLDTIERLGGLEAVRRHFAAAAFAGPPLQIID